MMDTRITFKTNDALEHLRVFCVDCCALAEIVWIDVAVQDMQTLVRLRCHAEERLVALSEFMSRAAATVQRGKLDLLWTELRPIQTSAGLEGLIRECDWAEEYSGPPPERNVELWMRWTAEASERRRHVREVLAWRQAHR